LLNELGLNTDVCAFTASGVSIAVAASAGINEAIEPLSIVHLPWNPDSMFTGKPTITADEISPISDVPPEVSDVWFGAIPLRE
jgi:hypothetical protein